MLGAEAELGLGQVDEPLDVLAIEAHLVDGLRGAHVAQFVWPIGRQHH